MNEITIFDNPEFGEIRTVIKDGVPMFCLADVCRILEIGNVSQFKTRLYKDGVITNEVIDSIGRKQTATFIDESNLYKAIFQSRKDNAEKFTRWVTSKVLPSIRKTGNYTAKPMTTEEKIKLLAQGNTELAERVDKVEDKIGSLENDMPLYGCEIDEVQKLVKRKVVSILGGKDSEAYADRSIRSQTFRDMYGQLKREFGCVSTYKSIKRRYIDDVQNFISSYSAPTALAEQINNANSQMNMGQYCDARR